MYQEVCFNGASEGGGGVNVGHSLSPPSHFMLATGLICRHFGIWCMGYCCGGWISKSSLQVCQLWQMVKIGKGPLAARAERIVIYAAFTLEDLKEVQESSILTFSVHGNSGNHWSFSHLRSESTVLESKIKCSKLTFISFNLHNFLLFTNWILCGFFFQKQPSKFTEN